MHDVGDSELKRLFIVPGVMLKEWQKKAQLVGYSTSPMPPCVTKILQQSYFDNLSKFMRRNEFHFRIVMKFIYISKPTSYFWLRILSRLSSSTIIKVRCVGEGGGRVMCPPPYTASTITEIHNFEDCQNRDRKSWIAKIYSKKSVRTGVFGVHVATPLHCTEYTNCTPVYMIH